MTTYISILRGINVGGQKKVRMDYLREVFESLNFEDVATYIQSGNLVFKASGKSSVAEMLSAAEKAIFDKFGFNVPVIILTIDELITAVDDNPYVKEEGVDPEKLHITFLAALPASENIEKLIAFDYPPDRFLLTGKLIYLHCPDTYGNSKLSNNFFESKLKVTATTRNWRTVNTLLEMAEGSFGSV